MRFRSIRLQLSLLLVLFPILFLSGQSDSTFIKLIKADIYISNQIRTAERLIEEGQVKAYAHACDSLLLLIEEKFSQENRVYIEWKMNRAIAALYYGNYNNCDSLARELVPLIKKVSGYESSDMVHLLNLRGVLSRRQQKLSAAKTFYTEAIAIAEQVLPPEDLILGSIMNNLAMVLEKYGKYYEALPLYRSALANAKTAVGEEHPEYAARLDNLTNLYWHLGKLDSIIYFRRRTAKIAEKALGTNHHLYSRYLFNLATEYQRLGMDEEALKMINQSNRIFSQQLDTVQLEFADRQNCLALSLNRLGRYHEALQALQSAMDICVQMGGKNSFRYAQYMHTFGILYDAAGLLDQAKLAYETAIQTYEKLDLHKAIQYIDALISFGIHIDARGHHQQAEQILESAASYFSTSAQKEQQFYLGLLQSLVFCKESLGKTEEVQNLMAEIHALQKKIHLPKLKYFSAKEQFGLAQDISAWRQRFENYLQGKANHPELLAIGFENSILSKELVRLNQAAVLQQLKTNAVPGLVDGFQQWLHLRTILGEQYRIPAEDRISAFDSLQHKANELESELSRTASSFREATEPLHWQRLQTKLQASEAVLNISHFHQLDSLGSKTGKEYYIAYILKKDAIGPIRIPLFERSTLGGIQAIRSLYKPSNPKGLGQLVWKKIAPHLSTIETIHYSPSGIFHRINLMAIPIDDQQILADRYRIRLSSNLRNLGKGMAKSYNDRANIYGDIAYDVQSLPEETEHLSQQPQKKLTALEEASINQYRSKGGKTWPVLPWTANESRNIAAILQRNGLFPELRKAWSATEESVKRLSGHSPRILHFATHGYFFDDGFVETRNSFRASDHPLIRSGLILAGANAAWQGEPMVSAQEDGILTAYEVSQLDLSNTELVVLSACDTGLGDIQGDEGVFGLQRALKLAGVKYIIMSLWNVKDRQSMEFMTSFYHSWLEEKEDIPSAFQSAQQKLRAQYATPFNPFLWAGFVLLH